MSWCAEKGLPHSALLDWEVEDRAKLHAYLIEESDRCGLCGTMGWEWTENRFAYTPVEKTCPGCYARHVAGEETGRLPGTTIILVPSSAAFLEKQRQGYEKAIRERKKAAQNGSG
jgi:hypothetical protein